MKQLSLDSKIKEVYAHPIGKDIIRRILLQMNVSETLITNPVIGNLTIKQVKKLTKKKLGEGFFQTFLTLLNSETSRPSSDDCEIKGAWWKEAVFYQIYPRSFCDSNGDGIGDLKGIQSKLDYLKELGVTALWFSPIYDSPNDDNGYDIRDYQKIWEAYGTMEEFDQLLEEIHKRDLKLIMDLVINHTSDEHKWFLDPQKEEYYLYREGAPDAPPNNWTSFFSGSAWKYIEEKKKWVLHLFSEKQMDVNWENPSVRTEIIQMIQWWLAKGVDGFRMDVINYISKTPDLPMGDELVGQLMDFYGIEHYFYGPRLYEYLKQIRTEAFAPFDAFSVGETPGIGMEMGKLLTGDDRGELDMIFSFDHLETPGHVRFDEYLYDLNYLKKYYIDWMTHYGNHCWMSLFLENHDNPRMLSKVEKDTALHPALAKLLLTIQFTLRGTPFIYQGQELGAANLPFTSIEQLKDVESINLYQELCGKQTEEEAFRTILAGTRDHARGMINWDVAKKQAKEDTSVYHYCQSLLRFRKNNKALLYGEIFFEQVQKKDLWIYKRKSQKETWYIECNLSNHKIERVKEIPVNYLVLSNYDTFAQELQPYQVNCYCEHNGGNK